MKRNKPLALTIATILTAASLTACESGGGDEEDVRGGNVEEELQDEDNPDD